LSEQVVNAHATFETARVHLLLFIQTETHESATLIEEELNEFTKVHQPPPKKAWRLLVQK